MIQADTLLTELLAGRPKDATGLPICSCGATIGESAFSCDRCIAAEKRRRQVEELEQRRAQWRDRVQRRLAVGGFPAWEFARVGTDAFADKMKRAPALARAAELYHPSVGNLSLLAKTGFGKTLAAAAIGRRFTDAVLATEGRRGWSELAEWKLLSGDSSTRPSEWDYNGPRLDPGAYFVRAAELARAQREHPLGEGLAPRIARAMRASWLVLDDLGNEPPGSELLMLEILDERYERHAPTLMTSGYTKTDLFQRYGDAMMRRFVEPDGKIVEAWE